jgi:hypothetical protein
MRRRPSLPAMRYQDTTCCGRRKSSHKRVHQPFPRAAQNLGKEPAALAAVGSVFMPGGITNCNNLLQRTMTKSNICRQRATITSTKTRYLLLAL